MTAEKSDTTGSPEDGDESTTDGEFDRLLRTAGDVVTTQRRRDYSKTLGPRAARTRQRIIDCARTMFYEQGLANTSASDIAEAAGCSLASFYSYFSDRNDVLRALVLEFISESAKRHIDRWDVRAGREGLREMIEAFVATFYEYRQFMELWEGAKLIDPAIRSLSVEYTDIYKRRSALAFEEGIEAGLISTDHAPNDLADALTAMLERYCYFHFVLRGEDMEAMAGATDLLTDLWADAIGLTDHSPRRRG